jgi:hypothetical protein
VSSENGHGQKKVHLKVKRQDGADRPETQR